MGKEEVKTVTLYSRDVRTANKTITLPLIGDTSFDEDNTIEVDEDKVEDLLKLDFGIKLSTSKEDKKEKEEDKDLPSMLKKLGEDELRDLLSTYPAEETKGLNKKSEIIKYLVSKK